MRNCPDITILTLLLYFYCLFVFLQNSSRGWLPFIHPVGCRQYKFLLHKTINKGQDQRYQMFLRPGDHLRVQGDPSGTIRNPLGAEGTPSKIYCFLCLFVTMINCLKSHSFYPNDKSSLIKVRYRAKNKWFRWFEGNLLFWRRIQLFEFPICLLLWASCPAFVK